MTVHPRLAKLLEPQVIARLAVSGFVLCVVIFVALRLLAIYPWVDPFFDLWAYWSTRFGLDYSVARPGDSGMYLYSPAFAHLIAPATALSWPIFAAAWTAMLAAVLYWLAGWRAFFLGALAPVAMSIAIGQLDLLMAAVVVIGFRWPVVWALPIITKLTPGIGLLWFAARREWRSLGMALGATLGIVTWSMLIDPAAWAGWAAMLLRFELPTSASGTFLPVPFWVRLPLVALLVVWGARTDRRWTLPIAVCFSLPTVWINTSTILVAILPLIALGETTPAGRWYRSPAADLSELLPRVRRRARWAALFARRTLERLLPPEPAQRI